MKSRIISDATQVEENSAWKCRKKRQFGSRKQTWESNIEIGLNELAANCTELTQ
jgi:hypothetical protein